MDKANGLAAQGTIQVLSPSQAAGSRVRPRTFDAYAIAAVLGTIGALVMVLVTAISYPIWRTFHHRNKSTRV